MCVGAYKDIKPEGDASASRSRSWHRLHLSFYFAPSICRHKLSGPDLHGSHASCTSKSQTNFSSTELVTVELNRRLITQPYVPLRYAGWDLIISSMEAMPAPVEVACNYDFHFAPSICRHEFSRPSRTPSLT
jgi:hypothetical protein